jgi:hypothetical protein
MKWARVAKLEIELDSKKIVKTAPLQQFTSALESSDKDRCSTAAAHLNATQSLNLILCESSFERAFALRLA